MGKKILFLAKLTIGSIIFYYFIFTKIDFSVLTTIKITYLFFILIIISILNSLIIIIIRTLRWQYILDKYYEVKSNFWDIQKIIYIGQFFSSFTPGRVGDLVRARYLKNKLGSVKAISSIISERGFDILIILMAMGTSFVAFNDELISIFKNTNLITSSLIIITLLLISIFIIYKFRKTKYHKEFFSFIKKIDIFNFIFITFISILIWVLTFIQAYILTIALGIDISLINVLLISGAMAFLNLLPITIASIGTTEISAFYLFSLTGAAPGIGVISLWLTNITISFMPALIGYFVYITWNSKKEAIWN